MKKELTTLEMLVLSSITGVFLGSAAAIGDESNKTNAGILLGGAATVLYPLTPFVTDTKTFEKAINTALLGTPTLSASYFTAYFLTRAAYNLL